MTQALDAWRSGTKPDAVPDVIVSDGEWSSGAELISYEVQGNGEPFGVSYYYNVLLEVRGGGTTQKKPARFMVGTNPSVTVTRHDPND